MKAVAVASILVGLLIGIASVAQTDAEVVEVAVQISPHTIVIPSPVIWVTAHVDISYWAVEKDSVELNGVAARFLYKDSLGQLVAKWYVEDILPEIGEDATEATLTLTGRTATYDFAGTDTVNVHVRQDGR